MVYDRKIYKEIGQAFVSPEIIGEILTSILQGMNGWTMYSSDSKNCLF